MKALLAERRRHPEVLGALAPSLEGRPRTRVQQTSAAFQRPSPFEARRSAHLRVTVRTPYSRRPGLGVGWLLVGILISIAAVCSSAAAQSPLSAEQERALKPKDSFKECTVCPEMVMVPAGAFSMGSPKNEKGRDDNESPQHKVTIAGAFAAGKFEV